MLLLKLSRGQGRRQEVEPDRDGYFGESILFNIQALVEGLVLIPPECQ